MNLSLRLAGFLLAVLVSFAVPAQQKFEPHVGQSGKDVIWVPTPDEVVERMLTMAQVTPGDFVWDLGAGDGKIAIMAAKKFGARAVGVEYNPDMVTHANGNAKAAGVYGEGAPGKAMIRHGDIFATNFTSATVITLYLLPSLNMKLRPQILSMRPGTRVVSHSFSMEDWEPDEVSTMDGRRAFFWMVPARVGGAWNLEAGGSRMEMTLEQSFQKLTGSTLNIGAAAIGLRDTRLRGSAISFSYVDPQGVRRDLSGRVTGDKMEGTWKDEKGAEGKWSAVKR